MSKFIKKQQYNSIDENIYDEFVDIDSITIEEIDKEIEDFYIDKEKINNIKFEFDKKLIIKEAIDKAEEDIKKEKNKKIISKVAACIAVILSIGIYNPALAYNIPPIMNAAALSGCQREIFFDRHTGRAAAHGVLKETPDLLGTLVLGGQRDIRTVQRDFAGVGDEASGNRAEERRLACAVCADD